MPTAVHARTKKIKRRVREQRATYRAASARASFKRVTRRQINAVVQRIVKEFNPEKVILFGSYAYGKPTVDSDVDLLVVMESEERPARRAIRVIRRLLDVPFPMDVLVRTPTEIMHRLSVNDYFLREIVEQARFSMSDDILLQWIERAEEDFRLAQVALRQRKYKVYNSVCFHAQQCAEKYLKAFLVRHRIVFRKTHDLRDLRRQCVEVDRAFDLLTESLLL